MATMEELRGRIDELDDELVRLLNQRATCALLIGAIKRANGMDIYQPDRETQVLRHVREATRARGGPLDGDAVTRLFERIIDENRRLERLAAADEGAGRA